MRPALIQVTSINFVIPKPPPPNGTSICGFNETPSCSVEAASAAKADVASIALEASARIDITKRRLLFLYPQVVVCIDDAHLPRKFPLVPHIASLPQKKRP